MFLIESSYMRSRVVIRRESYACMMGVGFLRENGELQTWVARMGYLWFCAVARIRKMAWREWDADLCAS